MSVFSVNLLLCCSSLAQGLLNFLWYGLNDSLKQAWLQVRNLTESHRSVVLSKAGLNVRKDNKNISEGSNLRSSVQSRHNHDTITTQSRHNHDTIATQSRHNHHTITTQSRQNHGTITTQSRHNHDTITTQSRHNHDTITTQSRHNDQGFGIVVSYSIIVVLLSLFFATGFGPLARVTLYPTVKKSSDDVFGAA